MRAGGIDMSDNELFIPKGSMCAVCAKQAATTECGKLDFSKMPVLRRDNDGYVIVKCSGFERQEYRSGS